MKRYEPHIIYPRDGTGPAISAPEKWDGKYVLASDYDALKAELEKAGLPVDNDQQSLQDLVGPELKKQVRTLNRLLPAFGV